MTSEAPQAPSSSPKKQLIDLDDSADNIEEPNTEPEAQRIDQAAESTNANDELAHEDAVDQPSIAIEQPRAETSVEGIKAPELASSSSTATTSVLPETTQDDIELPLATSSNDAAASKIQDLVDATVQLESSTSNDEGPTQTVINAPTEERTKAEEEAVISPVDEASQSIAGLALAEEQKQQPSSPVADLSSDKTNTSTADIIGVETSEQASAVTDTAEDAITEPITLSESTDPPLPSKQGSLPLPPVPTKTPPVVSDPAADDQVVIARAFGVETSEAPQSPASGEGKVKISPATPRTPGGLKIGKGPPPTTLPSEEGPFDFNLFLEQMKDPSARGVGEYVRSFIKGFAKKPYRTTDQIKLIFDFLDFISIRMKGCAVWAKLGETDFENAKEAMEKLVMNRLYTFTYTPAVAKEGRWTPQTDDLEKDRVLAERIELFSWIREEHLDVPVGGQSKGFVTYAVQELLKINHYKAPRDKLICILNCCKVIFGLIRHLSSEENADTFIPILIFVVLKANPEHLISNVEYIGRFRNPAKLSSESGYYLSSLMGATAFIETMDHSSLSNISQEEFEKYVEEAVAKIGSEPREATPGYSAGTLAPEPRPSHQRVVSTSDPHAPPQQGEEAARTLPGAAPNFADDTKAFLQRTGEAARMGFTNSLGRPIGALGKLLGEGIDGMRTPSGSGSGPNSVGGNTPTRDTPSPSNAPAARRGVFGNLFGAEEQQQQQMSQRPPSASNYQSGSWARSFRGGPGLGDTDDEPQTPLAAEHRQGPFSSLIKNPDYSNDAIAPRRKIGETPYAPRRAGDTRPQPQRSESLDPFHNEQEYSQTTTNESNSGGIGTPSDLGSEDEEEASTLARARRRLPDLGSFVPSFLSETPAPARMVSSSSSGGQTAGIEPRLTRGALPSQQRLAGHLGDSSLLQPSSDDPGADESVVAGWSADVDRVHEEQMAAGVETLRSVFPDTDEEVRRMVLEAVNGDVSQAIDRLLEINQG